MRVHQSRLAIALLCGALFGSDFRDLSRVRTVYIVSMTAGLDQFLANRLTNSGSIWIVLDPTKADAILADRLDETFWSWLNARFPATSKTSVADGDLRAKNLSPKMPGTVFLVDPRTRLVLWSSFDQPRTTSPDELDHVADRITKRLASSMAKKEAATSSRASEERQQFR
jgi:hypothetical protein